MKHSINLYTDNGKNKEVSVENFLAQLDIPVVLDSVGDDGNCSYYYFYREGVSVTFYEIADFRNGEFSISIDGLASFDDYKAFPYLADCLNVFLNGCGLSFEDGESVFRHYNDDWIEECIGEEIAMIKAALTVAPRYYPMMAFKCCCINLDQLSMYGVGLTSSTPRIYGYIQYLMRNDKLMLSTPEQMQTDWEMYDEDIVVDVPQHVSAGRVKSWQKDGSETWESFSREDVDMLVSLSERYLNNEISLDGVVLNDIGTIWQEGIGVEADGNKAEFWYREALSNGDKVFAPANLGDLFRKGGVGLPSSLSEAFKAYSMSTEPYAMYRIGQAYEEGWNGTKDMEKAFYWYKRSAAEGHHLAVKRLS